MYAFQNTLRGTIRKNTRTICLGFAIIAVALAAGIILRQYVSPMACGSTLTMSKYKKSTICPKRTLKVNRHIVYFTVDEKTETVRFLFLFLFLLLLRTTFRLFLVLRVLCFVFFILALLSFFPPFRPLPR